MVIGRYCHHYLFDGELLRFCFMLLTFDYHIIYIYCCSKNSLVKFVIYILISILILMYSDLSINWHLKVCNILDWSERSLLIVD